MELRPRTQSNLLNSHEQTTSQSRKRFLNGSIKHRNNMEILARLSQAPNLTAPRKKTDRARRNNYSTLEADRSLSRKFSDRKMTITEARSRTKYSEGSKVALERLRSLSKGEKSRSLPKSLRSTSNARIPQQPRNDQTILSRRMDQDLSVVMPSRQLPSPAESLQQLFEIAAKCLFNYYQSDKKDESSLTKAASYASIIQSEVGDLSFKNNALKGICAFQQGNKHEAVSMLAKALSQCSKFSQLRLSSKENFHPRFGCNWLYFTLADAYASTKNILCTLKVLDEWEKTVRKNRVDQPVFRKYSTNHRKGSEFGTLVAEKMVMRNKASIDRKETDSEQENLFQGYLRRARIHVRTKNFEQAIKDYEVCLANRSGWSTKLEVYFELAWQYHSNQQSEKAIRLLDQAESSFSIVSPFDLSAIHLQKAIIFIETAHHHEAEEKLLSIREPSLQTQVLYYLAELGIRRLGRNIIQIRSSNFKSLTSNLDLALKSKTCMKTVLKAYHLKTILLVLVSDFYGAQYDVDRYSHLMTDEFRIGMNFLLPNSLLLQLLEGILKVLKSKIVPGLKILSCCQENLKQLIDNPICLQFYRMTLQFQSYAFFVSRSFSSCLRKLSELSQLFPKTDCTIMNGLLAEAMLLMTQSKFTDAIMRLSQAEHKHYSFQGTVSSNSPILNENRILIIKSVCYLNLYASIQARNNEEDNKEILLSAEQMLMRCQLTQRENFEIQYLLAATHYELAQFETCLKYIRVAIENSDDHMVKHYFLKANAKLVTGRHLDAVKEFSNAVIVQSELETSKKPAVEEQFFQTREEPIRELFLHRAIAYIKLAFEDEDPSLYYETRVTRYAYLEKAISDLHCYFKAVVLEDQTRKLFRQEQLWLFVYAGEPQSVLKYSAELSKLCKFQVSDSILLGGLYFSKELNSCISQMRIMLERHKRKGSSSQGKLIEFDLHVLSLLKDSSQCQQSSYKKTHSSLSRLIKMRQKSSDNDGGIFQYSDIVFFIGVMEFYLEQYQLAKAHFIEAWQVKEESGELFSTTAYLKQGENFLQLFDDRTFSLEEIKYNVSICDFMMTNMPAARTVLARYSSFVDLLSLENVSSIAAFTTQSESSDELSERSQQHPNQFDITPFPVTDRLCSIYPTIQIAQKTFRLSFCLPSLAIPTLGLFGPTERVRGTRISTKLKQTNSEKPVFCSKEGLRDCISNISLKDIQMRPHAPWIRNTNQGVIFTQEVQAESIDLLSERSDGYEKKDVRASRYQTADNDQVPFVQ